MSAAPVEEAKLLGEALNTVKIQVLQMKRYLESDQLMDALKSASTMLAELRTSSLSPKQYYELYMSVFDALRHISNYLYDAHTQNRHHLADLYELVQYAGNIVPRLYLMITVGAVYMSVPGAPVKEIMKDMMEMSRGVQHPTRGLFLRHYLSGQTRDHLPEGDDPGDCGNLEDSISFVLTNFIEMNKLWVRLQHQGHSRDREKRELERRELRILVGTNLVRLSSLDGVDLDLFQRIILPSILEQVVNCKDVIAQEYLMEVVIQVFPAEFHLHSLGPFLSATAQLQPKVNIKSIVIALVDRLAAYAAHEAESEDPEITKAQEEAAAKRLAEKVKQQRAARAKEIESRRQNGHDAYETEWATSPTTSTAAESVSASTSASASVTAASDGTVETTVTAVDKGKGKEVKKFRGIPEDVQLFEVFWHQIVELIKARPDLALQDITALLVSLCNLGLSCYPDRLEFVDQVFEFAAAKTKELAENSDLHSQQTTTNFASLLHAPIQSYTSVLTLLALQQYRSLLAVQPFSTRRSIAHSIVGSVLKNDTVIENPEDVDAILELCQVLIREQRDATTGLGAQAHNYANRDPRRQHPVEQDDLAQEQGWLAKMVHLFRSDTLDVQFELLKAARRQFESGGDRMRFTYPALISACFKLARRYKRIEGDAPDPEKEKVTAILKFARQMLFTLSTQVEAHAPALRLFLLAAQVSDECGFEDLTYDFYVQAFSVYEESIPDSRAQLQAIATIIGTLQGAKVFSIDNYDTLIQKAAVHGSKLLKKPHQCSAVHLASHLWWQVGAPDEVVTEVDPKADAKDAKADAGEKKAYPHKDSKRILECLQRSLRTASSAIEEIVTVQMYIDALDQYLYYMERDAAAVTPKFVNSLVELITSSIDSITSTDFHPASRAPPGLVDGVQTPDMITRHFRNTLYHIQAKKAALANQATPAAERPNPKWNEVDVVGACLKLNIGAVNGHA